MSDATKVLVGRDAADGTWYAVRGHFGDTDFTYPDDWIAEGVGTWQRAMWWAWAYIRRHAPSTAPLSDAGAESGSQQGHGDAGRGSGGGATA